MLQCDPPMKRGLRITTACWDRDACAAGRVRISAPVRYNGDGCMKIRNAAAERALGVWLSVGIGRRWQVRAAKLNRLDSESYELREFIEANKSRLKTKR